jgi:hypothetical protein
MAINLEGKKKKVSGGLAPAPALDQLKVQLDEQAAQLEVQTRKAVQEWREETKTRLREAVAEELAIVAEDDDFFGFSGLFDDSPGEVGAIDVGVSIA